MRDGFAREPNRAFPVRFGQRVHGLGVRAEGAIERSGAMIRIRPPGERVLMPTCHHTPRGLRRMTRVTDGETRAVYVDVDVDVVAVARFLLGGCSVVGVRFRAEVGEEEVDDVRGYLIVRHPCDLLGKRWPEVRHNHPFVPQGVQILPLDRWSSAVELRCIFGPEHVLLGKTQDDLVVNPHPEHIQGLRMFLGKRRVEGDFVHDAQGHRANASSCLVHGTAAGGNDNASFPPTPTAAAAVAAAAIPITVAAGNDAGHMLSRDSPILSKARNRRTPAGLRWGIPGRWRREGRRSSENHP
mmetsp:Transcript_34399/g.66609  ORF Transcript_34399/g.66609 Transcript_34399/m.66609 type:complete len:298 (+) Transcript_34399:251-1144(+)